MYYYIELMYDNFRCYRSYGIIIASNKIKEKELYHVNKYNSIIMPITKTVLEEISLMEKDKLVMFYRYFLFRIIYIMLTSLYINIFLTTFLLLFYSHFIAI